MTRNCDVHHSDQRDGKVRQDARKGETQDFLVKILRFAEILRFAQNDRVRHVFGNICQRRVAKRVEGRARL